MASTYRYSFKRVALSVRNAEYGSQYYLTAQGDSFGELMQYGIVTEVNSKGADVSHCHVTECPANIAAAAAAFLASRVHAEEHLH
jgi:hypothetical protein